MNNFYQSYDLDPCKGNVCHFFRYDYQKYVFFTKNFAHILSKIEMSSQSILCSDSNISTLHNRFCYHCSR